MKLKLAMSKAGFWCRRHSPQLLIAGGLISFTLAVGSAIWATTKIDKVVKPCNARIESLKSDLKNPDIPVKETKKALALEYGKTAFKIATLYLPSALFLACGSACVLGSHKIMHNRNIAIAATAATIDNSFKAYRERVKEKLGEEAEEKLYKNVSKEKKQIVDQETGKSKAKTVEIPHLNPDEQFNVLFDSDNRNWDTSALRNFDFLMLQQHALNNKLMNQGFLFLSDVYESLGFTTEMLGPKKAQAAHVLGWLYDPTDNSRNSYVDFGLCEPGTRTAKQRITAQIESNEPSFWLTMNVDGDILTGNNNRVFTETVKAGY